MVRLRRRKELVYDGITLVPVDTREPGRRHMKDSWHLPGRTTATTKELVKRAEARGVSLELHEYTGVERRITQLV